jgi:hypothetical protein
MIKLPPLPDHLNAQWPYLPSQLRARDIEVARAALEAAAKVCDAEATDAASDGRIQFLTPTGNALYEGMYGGAINCAAAIRALRIEGEAP